MAMKGYSALLATMSQSTKMVVGRTHTRKEDKRWSKMAVEWCLPYATFWFYLLQFIVCTQLNDFKYCYSTLKVIFDINNPLQNIEQLYLTY